MDIELTAWQVLGIIVGTVALAYWRIYERFPRLRGLTRDGLAAAWFPGGEAVFFSTTSVLSKRPESSTSSLWETITRSSRASTGLGSM